MRLDGQAVLSARRSARPKLRCAACGQRCTAARPAEAGDEQDSARARAVWASGRDSRGLPLSRLQGDQARRGVPVPEATPWDQREQVGDCRYGVCASLERLAAQGELLSQDDTAVRMLSLSGAHRKRRAHAEALGAARPQERTGMSPTAVVVQVGERTICLYDGGRTPAGEHLEALVSKREADRGTPLGMSEARASPAADAQALLRGPCLAHGRRQCSARAAGVPQAGAVVLDVLPHGFDPHAEAGAQPLRAQERLASPPVDSGPLLEGRTRWLQQQCDERLVAPNSSLGQALASRQGHGATRTRFFAVPGAPLDHKTIARALHRFMRPRKHARFDATEPRASMASVLTSLLATCLHAGGKALESLVALPAQRAAVCAAPAAWLPWTSQASLGPPEATRRPSWAIWARSGSPCHSTMLNARADRGTRASAVWGPQGQRPGATRCRQRQEPCPSSRNRVSAVPVRLRKTETAPSRGFAPRACRHTAQRPAMPVRNSTGWVATTRRLWGGSCSRSAPPERPAPTLRAAPSTRQHAGTARGHRHGAPRLGVRQRSWAMPARSALPHNPEAGGTSPSSREESWPAVFCGHAPTTANAGPHGCGA